MDPLTMMAVSGLASTALGAVGASKASKEAAKAQKIRQEAANKIYDIDAPDIGDLQYDPALTAYTGDVNASLQGNLGDLTSASNDITSDPRFQTAQYQSLGALDDIIGSGGLTAADQLANQAAQGDASMQASREQAKVLQDAQERGMGGSGMELAARLSSSQGAANRGAAAAQTQQATAQQRALDAIMQRGKLGTDMQSADYAQQNSAAAAKDLIAKFNKGNAYEVQGANQQAQNQVNTNNQNLRQNVAAGNTNNQNQAAAANAGAHSTLFNGKLDQASKGSTAMTGVANGQDNKAQATTNMYKGLVDALPGTIGAVNTLVNPKAKTEDELNKELGSAYK